MLLQTGWISLKQIKSDNNFTIYYTELTSPPIYQVLVGGYNMRYLTEVSEAADVTDFDTNFKSSAILVNSIEDGISKIKINSKIQSTGEVNVKVKPPPIGSLNSYRYFSRLLDTVGDGTGSSDQNVNGSSTAQTFKLTSASDHDIYVSHIIIQIQDSDIINKLFGNQPSLTTGWDLLLEEAGVTSCIVDKAKTNGQLLTQVVPKYLFAPDSSKLNNIAIISGSASAFLCVIDLRDAIPGGFRLRAQGPDSLESVVNDNLTALTSFTVRALGYTHHDT